jgi:MarR family transcriptional regulator for hemolysin
MERDGWITRNSCPSDRRKKLIRATSAAEPVWEKIAEGARRVRALATEGISDQEVETLKQLLDRVNRNLERYSTATATSVETLT